jgi:hypothetical protein
MSFTGADDNSAGGGDVVGSGKEHQWAGTEVLPEPPTQRLTTWVNYDPALRRVWVGSQRLHHGASGAAVAAAGIAGLIVHRLSLPNALTATLLGTALMAHDWHDRSHWFEPGPQPD